MVKVAHSALGVDESVENIMAAAKTLGQSLPGGASNIRNMHLRTAESPALPIYISIGTNLATLKRKFSSKRIFDSKKYKGRVINLFTCYGLVTLAYFGAGKMGCMLCRNFTLHGDRDPLFPIVLVPVLVPE